MRASYQCQHRRPMQLSLHTSKTPESFYSLWHGNLISLNTKNSASNQTCPSGTTLTWLITPFQLHAHAHTHSRGSSVNIKSVVESVFSQPSLTTEMIPMFLTLWIRGSTSSTVFLLWKLSVNETGNCIMDRHTDPRRESAVNRPIL